MCGYQEIPGSNPGQVWDKTCWPNGKAPDYGWTSMIRCFSRHVRSFSNMISTAPRKNEKNNYIIIVLLISFGWCEMLVGQRLGPTCCPRGHRFNLTAISADNFRTQFSFCCCCVSTLRAQYSYIELPIIRSQIGDLCTARVSILHVNGLGFKPHISPHNISVVPFPGRAVCFMWYL